MGAIVGLDGWADFSTRRQYHDYHKFTDPRPGSTQKLGPLWQEPYLRKKAIVIFAET
jgi:hypothetical protein